MKKLISLILCIVMLASSLPAVFAGEESYTYPDWIAEAIADDKYNAQPYPNDKYDCNSLDAFYEVTENKDYEKDYFYILLKEEFSDLEKYPYYYENCFPEGNIDVIDVVERTERDDENVVYPGTLLMVGVYGEETVESAIKKLLPRENADIERMFVELLDYYSTPYIPGKYPGISMEEYEKTHHEYVNFKDEMIRMLKESEEKYGPDEMGISTYDIFVCFYRDAYDLPYTFPEADFPELEGKIESVKTYSDLHDRPDLLEDKDYMKRYTPMAYLTMKDQSYDALCDALDKLSERSTTDIMDAEPNYRVRIDLCESEPSAQGDVNRDENVDQKDAALLMQYLAGWDVQICSGADVNGDGEVNAKDANELLKTLAGWN